MNAKLPLTLTVLCIAIAGGAWMLWQAYPAYDLPALIVADMIMLLLSFAARALVRKSVAGRPQVFVRGVYGVSMLRLFVCLAGVLIYALINRTNLHKPTLFAMFGIYMAYTIIETVAFSNTAKKVR